MNGEPSEILWTVSDNRTGIYWSSTNNFGGRLPPAVARLGVHPRQQRAALRGAARRVLQRCDELQRVQRHHAVVVVRRQY